MLSWTPQNLLPILTLHHFLEVMQDSLFLVRRWRPKGIRTVLHLLKVREKLFFVASHAVSFEEDVKLDCKFAKISFKCWTYSLSNNFLGGKVLFLHWKLSLTIQFFELVPLTSAPNVDVTFVPARSCIVIPACKVQSQKNKCSKNLEGNLLPYFSKNWIGRPTEVHANRLLPDDQGSPSYSSSQNKYKGNLEK